MTCNGWIRRREVTDMSYSPEHGRDARPAPWASPSTADSHDTERFDEAPAAGSTRVDHPVDVTPDRAPDQAAQPGFDRAPEHAYLGAPAPGYGPPPAFPDDPTQPQPQTQPQPYAQPGGPWGPTPPPLPAQGTGRRGPGWVGVVAVGAGAAVLSSLLTLGIAENRLDSSPA